MAMPPPRPLFFVTLVCSNISVILYPVLDFMMVMERRARLSGRSQRRERIDQRIDSCRFGVRSQCSGDVARDLMKSTGYPPRRQQEELNR